ncbi:transcription initiation factor TFIID TATA-box-binding protein [Strigomonas culicis]|uniref:Transcription initiation factor TFIID TATA-box-binding protein n=1 Tax=Strigomonas culicis TaxID=28005 RepID=S9W322_9TRYP|nr:transcription initiation factor TFIID TATA-box-binding protein [Strigomonas culicis]|eukprot:EPY33746.1 transcription initiation factor TFIID TATA-box-binding protein [Strigomonas culicis]
MGPDDDNNNDLLDLHDSALQHHHQEAPLQPADDAAALVPPPIEDLTVYLPNVPNPKAFPVVVAVIAQAEISEGVDLRLLSCAARNVEYLPHHRIPAATMRLNEPNAVAQIRSSGTIHIVGAASISESRCAAELTVRILRRALHLRIDSFRFRVRSIMARFNLCSPVRLDDLAHHTLDPAESPGVSSVFCSFEPERHMGCIVRLESAASQNRWRVSSTVYVTGKVNMIGARSMEELQFAFDALVPIVSKYLGKAT